jgi:hypothetical protein
MPTPAIAEEMCRRYMAAFDEQHPGLLTGLYLVGSIALDDFQPGCSDIDFVAMTRRRVDLADVTLIHALLLSTPGQPFFDGVYVTEQELRALPDRDSRGVAVLNGMPLLHSAAERHTVTWLTLARYGIAIRGRAPSASWIAADLVLAQAYSYENLQSYWLGWIASRRAVTGLSAEDVAWSVLGVSRLHALMREGLVLSKTAAGHYAVATFPRHRSIIEAALAVREARGDGFVVSTESRSATFAFLDDAIADATSCGAP